MALTLYQTSTRLELSKFEAFADNKMVVPEKSLIPLGRLENNVGEEKMLGICTCIFSFSHNVFITLLTQSYKIIKVPIAAN